MAKAVIYGVSGSLPKLLAECEKENFSVIAFSDSDKRLWGREVSGIPIIPPEKITDFHFDFVIIGSCVYHAEIFDILINEIKIPPEKINESLIYSAHNWYAKFDELKSRRDRIDWLHQYADIIKMNHIADGSIAEVGVFRGEFAKEMNACFPDRTIYLFDTFGGYGKQKTQLSTDFSTTSVEMVREILPHPEKAIFKVGYFPESAGGGG